MDMLTALQNQGLTPDEAQDVIDEIQEQANELFDEGASYSDFEDLLADYGLEPDYLMDLFS